MGQDHATFEDRLAAYRASRDPDRHGTLAQAVARGERIRRQRRRIVFACVGAVVLLLVGSCSAVRLTVLPERQARAAVLSYLEALADPGSAWSTTEAVVAPEVIADVPLVQRSDGNTEPAVRQQLIGSSSLRSNQCLAPGTGTHTRGPVGNPKGCYAPPTGATVTDVRVDNHEAVVSVEYGFEGDDERYAASVRLRRETGPIGTVTARWRILDAFGTLDLSPVGSECVLDVEPPHCVTLDGFPVEDMAGPGSRPTVLPGRHQLEVHVWTPPIGWQSNSPSGWQSTVFTAVVAPGAHVVPEPVT